MKTKHPNQPVILDEDYRARFKQNDIVRYLLDNGGIDLNALARIPFDDDDRNQFAQLIGYSVVGFGELDYADPERVEWADKEALIDAGLKEFDKRELKMDDTANDVIQTLLNMIAQSRNVNQDGARFKAEIETYADTVSVTYRLEIEVSK